MKTKEVLKIHAKKIAHENPVYPSMGNDCHLLAIDTF